MESHIGNESILHRVPREILFENTEPAIFYNL